MAKIHSYESFGTVDGPGVRFVVFMQGCPMRCAYCHNPDTWKMDQGKEVSAEDVFKEIMKYRHYIEDGGVTLSGGEPLVQLDFVIELFSKLKEQGIHTCVDTSGIMFDKENDQYIQLLKVCDLFLVDLKHIDNVKHQELTQQENRKPIEFMRFLNKHHQPMWIRHVLVEGYTNDENYLKRTREFLNEFENIEKIEVLPYHSMGEVKYEKLHLDYPLKGVEPPSSEDIQRAKEILGVKSC